MPQAQSRYRVLSRAWTPRALTRARDSQLSSSHSVNELLKEHWQDALETRNADRNSESAHKPFTLGMMAKVYDTLRSSPDLDADLYRLISNSEPKLMSRLLFETGDVPLAVFRSYMRLHAQRKIPALGYAESIDEAIIANEYTLRHCRGEGDRHLMGIPAFLDMLGIGKFSGPRIDHCRSFVPASELPVLDALRPQAVSFCGSDDSFERAFSHETSERLQGLDWQNVFAVGSFVHSLYTRNQIHGQGSEAQTPIDLYLYGLGSAEAADSKLRHIVDVWTRNHPADFQGGLRFVRQPSYILVCVYDRDGAFEQALRISLHVCSTKTECLLHMDLDAHAMGFDGTRLAMLPRCARALQTGYNMLTARVLDNRLARQGCLLEYKDVLEHSQDGYGLRTIPLYTKTLEDASLGFSDALHDAVDDSQEKENAPAAFEPVAAVWPTQCQQRQVGLGDSMGAPLISRHLEGLLFYRIRRMVRDRTGAHENVALDRRQYVDYLSGRVRLAIVADDLPGLFRRDLKVPLLITKSFEGIIAEHLPDQTLQPVYSDTPELYTHSLPPLLDSDDETGNLRYWAISRDNMWTGIDSSVEREEATRLVRLLAAIFKEMGATDELYDVVLSALMTQRASMFPQVPGRRWWKQGVLSLKDAIIYRAWATASPPKPGFGRPQDEHQQQTGE